MGAVKNAFHDEILAAPYERDGIRTARCGCGCLVSDEELPCKDAPDCAILRLQQEVQQ